MAMIDIMLPYIRTWRRVEMIDLGPAAIVDIDVMAAPVPAIPAPQPVDNHNASAKTD